MYITNLHISKGKRMKKLLILIACGMLSPTFVYAAQDESATEAPAPAVKKHRTKRHVSKKKDETTPAKKHRKTRSKKTTLGAESKTSNKKAGKVKSHTKTTTRSKTTALGHKKTTTVSKTTTEKKPTHVYRKGGVTFRHFRHLNDAQAQNLGVINKTVTGTIALNKPGKGYRNANQVIFTTQNGKTNHIVLDTHHITAKRAERKGFAPSTHGMQSVEVFAGTDAKEKGLALIGEYPLHNNNSVEIAVEPNGTVILSGTEKPVEFVIHQ